VSYAPFSISGLFPFLNFCVFSSRFPALSQEMKRDSCSVSTTQTRHSFVCISRSVGWWLLLSGSRCILPDTVGNEGPHYLYCKFSAGNAYNECVTRGSCPSVLPYV